MWAAGPAEMPGRTQGVDLTNAARLGDFVEGPEEVTPQLLDIDEVIKHGVGQVHQVVQVDGVALGAPEGHIEHSLLTCGGDGREGGASRFGQSWFKWLLGLLAAGLIRTFTLPGVPGLLRGE